MAKNKKSQQPDLNVHMRRKKRRNFIYIFSAVLFVALLYLGLLIGTTMNCYRNMGLFEAFPQTFEDIAANPAILVQIEFGEHTMTPLILFGLLWFFISAMLIYNDLRHSHDLDGIEKGSAKLNDDYKGFDKQFGETDKLKTTYLSRNVALSMNTRKTLRNNNVLIIGGSGAGKTRFFVKPNILQANCNMVITDPSGEILESLGTFLKEDGYEVKIFNLVEMQKSNCYNPFHYIRDDQGVIMMINCLIKNTTPPDSHSGDPFWEKSETALLQALCFYLKDHRPVEEQNFATVMELLRWAEVDERNPDFESKLDRIFLKSKQKSRRMPMPGMTMAAVSATPEEMEFNKYMAKTRYQDKTGKEVMNQEFKSLEELDPTGTDIAVKQYKIFKMGAGKTAKSILISCAVRLTVFNLPQVAQLTRVDDIHLEDLGGTNPDKKKQALFVIIPAADSTFNFLVSMMYSQLFETLYFVAETNPACNKKRLPRHVKFLLDEFANIGTIPEFTKKLATMRKYEISCSVILQNLAQIKTMYKDDWESIVGNCDTMVFLGGKEYTTLEYISKELGEQTIYITNTNIGGKGGGSKGRSTEKRPLMTPDELGNMDNSQCVVQVRGINPFLDYKFDYLAHSNYHKTSDYDEKLTYINNIDNMQTIASAYEDEDEDDTAEESKAKAVSVIASVEDLIAANPDWADFADLFKEFKTVPSASEYVEEMDELVEAIAADESSDDEIEDENTSETVITPNSVEALVRDYKQNGRKPSQNPAFVESARKNFFDDEAEAEN